MERVPAGQIAQFLKRFRFQKGILKGVVLRNRKRREQEATVSLIVSDLNRNRRVGLKMRFDGVEEYRFQCRPNGGLVRLTEVRLGYFDGLIYFNLDAYPDDDAPRVMDFRASDAFVAAREMSFEVRELGSTANGE